MSEQDSATTEFGSATSAASEATVETTPVTPVLADADPDPDPETDGNDTTPETPEVESSVAADTSNPDSSNPDTDSPEKDTDAVTATTAPLVVRKRSRKPQRWLVWVGAVAVTAIAIVAVVSAVVFGLKWQDLREQDEAGQAAKATATSYAITLTSVDPNRLDQNFQAVLAGATGNFKKMYADSSAQLRQVLLDNKATGKGSVIQAAVKSASKNRVEVLLFVDQTVTNASSAEPRVDRSRILMTMQKVDGTWLASDVELP